MPCADAHASREQAPHTGRTRGTAHHIHITTHHITSHHITSHNITSQHITSHHITSHHTHITLTSHHITSHHITSHHSIAHHITSHQQSTARLRVLPDYERRRFWGVALFLRGAAAYGYVRAHTRTRGAQNRTLVSRMLYRSAKRPRTQASVSVQSHASAYAREHAPMRLSLYSSHMYVFTTVVHVFDVSPMICQGVWPHNVQATGPGQGRQNTEVCA